MSFKNVKAGINPPDDFNSIIEIPANGMFSKTLLNLRLMPQRSQAPITEPRAIDKREKYMSAPSYEQQKIYK